MNKQTNNKFRDVAQNTQILSLIKIGSVVRLHRTKYTAEERRETNINILINCVQNFFTL